MLLGKVLKLLTQIPLLVEDLQISVLVVADQEPQQDPLVFSHFRSIGGDVPVDDGFRHAMEDEDDGFSPLKGDVSRKLFNFKSFPLRRDSSSRLRGRGGSSCCSGSGSTSSIESAGIGFALEPGSGSLTGWTGHPKVGPAFDPSPNKLEGSALDPRSISRASIAEAFPEKGARVRSPISSESDDRTNSPSSLAASARTTSSIAFCRSVSR